MQQIGAGTAPTSAPLILGTWVIEPRVGDDQEIIGGRVVRLCGLDGRDRPYAGEVLVETVADGLLAGDAVFWNSTRVAGMSALAPLPTWPPSITADCPP